MLNKKIFFILAIISIGCIRKVDTSDTNYTYQFSRLKSQYVNTYEVLLERLRTEHVQFEKTLGNFINYQQLSFFGLSKTAWEDTYSAYLLLGPFTQSNNYFSNALSTNKERLNLNRMNEGYIDYTQNNPSGGIINNPAVYPNLSLADILDFNQVGGASNVSIGFHAIEFLLWGEDLQTNGPGNRSAGDFIVTFNNGERRRNYLRSLNERLKNDLNSAFIETGMINSLKKLNASESGDLLFNSLTKQINYLAEDLINKALNTQDEFYELDKFSDKTNIHLLKLLEGINLYINPKPILPSDANYFIIDFLTEVNPDGAAIITNELESAKTHLQSLTLNFDQAISNPVDIAHLQSVYNSLVTVKQQIDEFLSRVQK